MNKKNKEALVELLTGIHETLKAIHQQMATPTGKDEVVGEKISPKQTRTEARFVIHKTIRPWEHIKIEPFLVCGEVCKICEVFCVSDVRPSPPRGKAHPPCGGWVVDLPRYATGPIWASKALFSMNGGWGGCYWSEPVRISEPVGCFHITK